MFSSVKSLLNFLAKSACASFESHVRSSSILCITEVRFLLPVPYLTLCVPCAFATSRIVDIIPAVKRGFDAKGPTEIRPEFGIGRDENDAARRSTLTRGNLDQGKELVKHGKLIRTIGGP